MTEDPHEKIYGVKCIAAALGRNERYVRRMSSVTVRFRLPLRRNHLGIYITRWRLQNWIEEHDVAHAPDAPSDL